MAPKLKDKKPLNLEIKAFLDSLKYNRGLSNHTLKSYKRDLSFLDKLDPDKSAHDIKMDDIRIYVQELSSKGLSSSSIARHLSSWRGFFSHACPDGKNPCLGIKVPRGAKKLPSALSVDQAVALVSDTPSDALGIRDQAMFELMYSSGLRVTELVNSKIIDLNCHNQTIRILGKGGKTRIVPVGQKAMSAIEEWLNVRKKLRGTDSGFLFFSSHRKQISQRTVQRRLSKLAKEKLIDIPVTPHVLRHSFASHILQSSGDLRAVQELLGHSSIKSTQIYSHLDWDHLARVYDTSHPRAKSSKSKLSENDK